MNLVNCYALEVISTPNECYGLWYVDLKYASCGHITTGSISGLSKKEALRVKPRYVFQS